MHIKITHLAGLGDGVGSWQGQRFFVPFTAPGDEVEIMQEGKHSRLHRLLKPGDDRQTPVCRHFGECGGCQLQHITPVAYSAFKQGIAASTARKLAPTECLPLVETGLGQRRRVNFAVAKHHGEMCLGFYAQRSHRLIPLAVCPVLTPALEALIAPLNCFLKTWKAASQLSEIILSESQTGIEGVFAVKTPLKTGDQEALCLWAQGNAIGRVVEEKEGRYRTLYEATPPQAEFSGVRVTLPPGAFLQATQNTEAVMQKWVLQSLEGYDRVVDLFCGIGTFSFPLLVAGHRVEGYEGWPEAVAAAHNALKNSAYAQEGRFSVRDLHQSPVEAQALKPFDAALINPPRNGALPQAGQLAKSGIRRIVMVSCNPATFERDAKTLLQSGYRLHSLLPVDQFLLPPI